ncbi:MAG: DUF4352 domain-containing protein [Lachnospiraceae bacterium]|nr:DUF4352 domain-containing protein [Lachnospiraceae bacterium]
MKKTAGIIGICLTLVCLTACGQTSAAERHWSAAAQDGKLENYVKEHIDNIDMEALETMLQDGETPLDQQLKATAVICMLEYCETIRYDLDLWEASVQSSDEARGAMYRAEYPVGAAYAQEFLTKVSTEGEAFWEAMEEASYPYDGIPAVFAAAKELEEDTLLALIEGAPADSLNGDRIRETIGNWIRKEPTRLAVCGQSLAETGYFEDWDLRDWQQAFLASDQIRTESVDGALAYVGCLRDGLLPMQEKQFGEEEFKKESPITGEICYNTNLAVTVEEELSLQAPVEEGLPEVIDTEGKKVIAFYRNPHGETFPGSPAPLRVLGDFMLNLTDQEYPATVDEADYYLVLTPEYGYGAFYQDRTSGSESEFQEIYSYTSIDLYQAGTGVFLRHLGTMIEEAPSTIVTGYGDNSLQYPMLVESGALAYIYRHVNEPEAYVGLTDQLGERTEFGMEEPVVVGNWELTLHSSEIVKTLESGIFASTAEEGCQYVKARLSVTNVGLWDDTFLPMMSQYQNLSMGVTDAGMESFYEYAELITMSDYLCSELLEPGESEEGNLVFEVPETLLQGDSPLYIVVVCGYQVALFPIQVR